VYQEHFRLRQAPFRITPDTRFFYAGGKRGQILDALVYAIAAGEGIVEVIGEVGSGKTMLCRMLETRLPESVEIVYLANPSVSAGSILHAIALEMGLALEAGANRLEVLHALQRCLLEKHAQGRQVVVFVEEAQSVPLDTLEQMRLLSNLETQREKLLQIVLFGQPELGSKLGAPEMRQLRERITHRFMLPPLRSADVAEYVEFRVHAGGYQGPGVLFTRPACRALARRSEGLIRRVNILADKALLAAFAEDAPQVRHRHVRAAIADSDLGWRPWRGGVVPVAAAALLAGTLIGGWAALRAAGVSSRLLLPPWNTMADGQATGSGEAAASTPHVHVRIDTRRPRGAAVVAAPEDAPVWRGDQAAAIGPASASAPARPPASADGGNPAQASSPRSLLAGRLDATAAWLARAARGHFSIQVLMTDTRSGLEQFLLARQSAGDIDDLYVYRTTVGGRTWFGVLYKEYATYREAREALHGLAPELRRHRPFIRNIRDVAQVG
jgi:MSHA biogenesis protein MshM